jgi:hypothetical protein
MACVLRAIGTTFDVDAFLRDSELPADPAFHKGEPRDHARPDGPRKGASGFNVTVSRSGLDDLEGQVTDATHFLNEYEDELRRLGAFEGVEEVCLDFAVERRDVAGGSDLFPAGLLWRAGALDIDLVVTQS